MAGSTVVAMSDENEVPPPRAERPNPFDWAPVCQDCRKGAMLRETYAEALQSDDGVRVAVVVNVPRRRCAVCGHTTIGPTTAVKTGGLLAAALTRYEVSVVDYEKHAAEPDVAPVEVEP